MSSLKFSMMTVAVIALGALTSGQALAGASASAASKTNHAVQTANVQRSHGHRASQTAGVEITQFTSSSASSRR